MKTKNLPDGFTTGRFQQGTKTHPIVVNYNGCFQIRVRNFTAAEAWIDYKLADASPKEPVADTMNFGRSLDPQRCAVGRIKMGRSAA